MAGGPSAASSHRIGPPHRGHVSRSARKERFSYCTSCRGCERWVERWGCGGDHGVGWKVFRKPVEPFAAVIADAAHETALGATPADGRAGNAELGGELLAGQHAGFEESLFEALELGGEAYPLHADRIEGVAGAGSQSALVEEVVDLGIGVLIEQG